MPTTKSRNAARATNTLKTVVIKRSSNKKYAFYEETRQNISEPATSTGLEVDLARDAVKKLIIGHLPEGHLTSGFKLNILLVDTLQSNREERNDNKLPIEILVDRILKPIFESEKYKNIDLTVMAITNRQHPKEFNTSSNAWMGDKSVLVIKPNYFGLQPVELNDFRLPQIASAFYYKKLQFDKFIHRFELQLKELSIKKADLKDRGFETAYEAANTLEESLKASFKALKNSNLDEDAYKTFRDETSKAFEKAKPALNEHRGISKTLSNLAAAIAFLGALYFSAPLAAFCFVAGLAKLYSTGTLFSPQTATGKLVDHMREELTATPSACAACA